MRQGEPFHNYDQVLRAAGILAHPCGARIASEAITISTVGLVAQIRRYTEERHPYRLIVSLTSAVEERRARLLPVAGKVPMDELVAALRDHAAQTGRVTVAWVLLGGENDGLDEIEALRERLAGVPIRVNLVDVNDLRPDGFRRSTPEELRQFMDGLQVLRVPVVRRYSVGREQHSACGMLAGA